MKTLLILRHAKSSHDDPGTSDHDRPLNKRGRRDAPQVAELLKEKKLIPDWIVCSTATRARETTEFVISRFRDKPSVEYRSEIYLAPPQRYVDILRELDGNANTVLIVGHNPGLEVWVEMLGGESAHFPTAALAQFELPIDSWSDLTTKTRGELKLLWNPKEGDELA